MALWTAVSWGLDVPVPASFSWDIPNERENGFPLTPEELAGYEIYIQDERETVPPELFLVDGGSRTSWDIKWVLPITADSEEGGTVRVKAWIKAVDTEGLTSMPSEVVYLDVPVPGMAPGTVMKFIIRATVEVQVQ